MDNIRVIDIIMIMLIVLLQVHTLSQAHWHSVC